MKLACVLLFTFALSTEAVSLKTELQLRLGSASVLSDSASDSASLDRLASGKPTAKEVEDAKQLKETMEKGFTTDFIKSRLLDGMNRDLKVVPDKDYKLAKKVVFEENDYYTAKQVKENAMNGGSLDKIEAAGYFSKEAVFGAFDPIGGDKISPRDIEGFRSLNGLDEDIAKVVHPDNPIGAGPNYDEKFMKAIQKENKIIIDDGKYLTGQLVEELVRDAKMNEKWFAEMKKIQEDRTLTKGDKTQKIEGTWTTMETAVLQTATDMVTKIYDDAVTEVKHLNPAQLEYAGRHPISKEINDRSLATLWVMTATDVQNKISEWVADPETIKSYIDDATNTLNAKLAVTEVTVNAIGDLTSQIQKETGEDTHAQVDFVMVDETALTSAFTDIELRAIKQEMSQHVIEESIEELRLITEDELQNMPEVENKAFQEGYDHLRGQIADAQKRIGEEEDKKNDDDPDQKKPEEQPVEV